MTNQTLLFYAFRYALGRMTYAVSEVTDAILECKDEIVPHIKAHMIQEIREAEKENRLGMECDRERWLNVLAQLQGHAK